MSSGTHWLLHTDAALPSEQRLVHVQDCSPFASALMARHPQWQTTLSEDGRLDSSTGPSNVRLGQWVGEFKLDIALRRFRNQEMLRIVWRDLCGLAPLGETLGDMTVLAELCLEATVAYHDQKLARKFGRPRDEHKTAQRLVVIGMGKLGGKELNLSSDIDIIFAFPRNGQCDGPRKISNEVFFSRLARAVINSLSDITEDGFCFRVDTRLRPFGQAGPIAASFAAMEQYYQREGRDWERYALVKARLVAGDIDAGARLMQRLSPFIYRRYIDFGAIEALQEMHASVRADAERSDRLDDIKRGPGGIREIEFLAQTFQLLRGGRELELQTQTLAQSLNQIESLDLIEATSAAELRSDYTFMRKLENRVQGLHDQQVHQLPHGDDLLRIVRAMRLDSPNTLQAQLALVRDRVTGHFQSIFPSLPEPEEQSRWTTMWRGMREDMQAANSELQQLSLGPREDFMQRLQRQVPSDRARRRLDRFIPVLLERIDRASLDPTALARVFDLVVAITRRSGYLILLVQHTPAIDRLLDLFSRSRWIADKVIRYPALLDELIDPSLGRQLPAPGELQQSISRILTISTDTEARLDNLNHLKQATMLRVAVAHLRGVIRSDEVLSILSVLADSMIRGVMLLAAEEIRHRHGDLAGPQPDGGIAGIAVIGYGTLGARELGYDSDLDLVFLFQAGTRRSDGRRPLDAPRWFGRLAQRMLSFLTASTPSGRLYAADTRLRPNGRAGALVSSIAAFESYQLNDAWLWERQALTRARFVAGDETMAGKYDAVRRAALQRPIAAPVVIEALGEMRAKMRSAHQGDTVSSKHRLGGLIDIEFIAQLGVLSLTPNQAELLAETNTAGQLRTLQQVGWLDATTARELITTMIALRQARLMALLGGNASAADESATIGTSISAAVYRSLFHAADDSNPGCDPGSNSD